MSDLDKKQQPLFHIKYQLFDFHDDNIKNIDFQKNGELMAFSGKFKNLICIQLKGGIEQETLKLVQVKVQVQSTNKLVFQNLQEIKKNISVIRWSPNNQLLATACQKVVIYQLQMNNLIQVQEYNDHELDITGLTWSPDSTSIASASLGSKVFIRKIGDNGSPQQLIVPKGRALGLIWDPLDKYLIALTSENKVIVWNVTTWNVDKTINLSFKQQNVTGPLVVKREDRKMDWSPDYKYILVPSLDDRIVPVVCAIERQTFEIKYTYMGPFSSINCVRFSPNLYEKNNQIFSVFAMGDNDGNISIWGLSDQLQIKKPFYLFKSHTNGNELIEDIAWNEDVIFMISNFKIIENLKGQSIQDY